MSTIEQNINLCIGFVDTFLPIFRGDDGQDRVPVRLILEQFDVPWNPVRRRIVAGTYQNKHLGIKLDGLKASTGPMFCIRLDRVAALLNAISPKDMRGMSDTEDKLYWLEVNRREWDDVLRDYANNEALIQRIHRVLDEQRVAEMPASLPVSSNDA